MIRRTVGLTCFLGAWAGNAMAVPYTLPSGPDVNLAQLQTLSDYSTVCETGAPCDVPAGDYQLVVFDALWVPTTSNVTVNGGSSGITLVTEVCDVFGPGDIPVLTEDCTATCPAGAVATGGACSIDISYDDFGTVSPVASSAGENSYTCSTIGYISEHDLDPDRPLGPITTSVYCLSP